MTIKLYPPHQTSNAASTDDLLLRMRDLHEQVATIRAELSRELSREVEANRILQDEARALRGLLRAYRETIERMLAATLTIDTASQVREAGRAIGATVDDNGVTWTDAAFTHFFLA